MAILSIKPLPHIWLAHDKERKHRKTDRQSLAAEESLLDRKVRVEPEREQLEGQSGVAGVSHLPLNQEIT